MCRLFGCRSLEPSGVAHELLHASNALRVQSKEHPDGWGVGWYENGAPRVVRSLTPAHGDAEFERVSSFVHAETVVAHVRQASVGRVSAPNTHPFQWGPWLFVHNGTVPEFARLRGPLETLTDPAFRKLAQGETDSERCFHLFLTELGRLGDPERATAHAAAVALARTVRNVHELSRGAERPASTTFLATDGRILAACRRGRTLHLAATAPNASEQRDFVALASENPGDPPPGGRSGWTLLEEDALVTVDASLRLRVGALSADA